MLINLAVDRVVEIDARGAGIGDGDTFRQEDGIVERDGSVVDGDVCFEFGRTGRVGRETFQSGRSADFGEELRHAAGVHDQVRTGGRGEFVNGGEEGHVVQCRNRDVCRDVDGVLECDIHSRINVIVEVSSIRGIDTD